MYSLDTNRYLQRITWKRLEKILGWWISTLLADAECAPQAMCKMLNLTLCDSWSHWPPKHGHRDPGDFGETVAVVPRAVQICSMCFMFFPTWTWHGESMRRTIMINYINYICTMYMCFPTTRINGLIFIWKFFSQTPQAPQLRLRHPFQLQNLFRSSHMCHPSFSMVSQLHQLQVPNLKEVGTVLSRIQSVNLGEDVIDVRDKLN